MRIITTRIKYKHAFRGYTVVVDMINGGHILNRVENIFERAIQLYEIID